MKPRVAFHAYRMLSRFSEILPERAIAPVSNVIGGVVSLLARDQRKIVASNLEHVIGRPPASRQVRESYASYVRYWLGSMRLPIIPSERLDAMLTIEGREHVDVALAEGRGCIIALPHLGNWEIAAAWYVRHVGPLTVVVERLEPPELFVWFKDFRESLGMRVAVNQSTIGTQLSAALRRNEAVALLCDRDVDGSGVDVEFFGSVTKVPKGPATLALRTGAALIPLAVYETANGFHVAVRPPVDAQREGSLRDDVTRVTRQLMSEIEALVRRAPTQWHVFQPNWPGESSDERR